MLGFFHDPICNPTTSNLHRLLGLEPNIENLQNIRFTRDLRLDDRGKELDHA
jgi:hypothetical protein